MRTALVVLLAATCVSASPLPASAQGIVFDPSVFGRQFEQLTEMKRQFEALSSQLTVSQDQLGQAKQLYDSLNKTISELGGLVADIRKDPRKYLRVKVSIF